MKRLVGVVTCLGVVGCSNFEALVERCAAEGRCGVGGMAGSGGAGGGTAVVEPPSLVAQPVALTFTLAAGDTAPTQRVTLQNADGGQAEALAVNLGGANAADFRVTNACGTTLALGQSCPLDIGFQPSAFALGQRDAVLEIRASQGAAALVPLTGTITAGLALPSTLDFGDVTIGTQRELTLVVRNLSTRAAALVPTVASPFSVRQNGCSSVGPMQSCAVQLVFESPSPGPRDETLQMSVIGSTAVQTTRLTARAVTPGVLRIDPQPLWPVNTTVVLPSTSTTSFALRNTGTQHLGGLTLSVVGSDSGVSILDAGCSELAPATSCNGALLFQAAAVGSYSVELVVDGGAAGIARANATVHAVRDFDLQVQVAAAADAGVAVVMPDGGLCTGTCTFTARHDPRLPTPTVTLSAVRSDRLDFGAWTGDCTGSGTCTVSLDANRAVSATFARVPMAFVTSLQVQGNFGGVDAGDAICSNLARDAGLVGSYGVFLGLPDGGGFNRVPANQRGWLRVDGRVFTAERMNLWLTNPPLTERGGPSAAPFFTGTGLDGGLAMTPTAGLTATCSNWTTSGSPGAHSYLAAFGTGTSVPWWNSTGGYQPFGDHCSSKALLCFDTSTTGAPRPVQRDAGLALFVAQRVGPSGDGGVEFFDPTCDAGARSLGFASGYALISLSGQPAANRVPLMETRPVSNLAGSLLFPSAQTIRSTTVPLAPVMLGLLSDGGIGPPPTPAVATGGASYPTNLGGACSNYTTTSGASDHGDARSAAFWWDSSNLFQSCTTTPWIYCVATP